jgi:hypothetical protein|eukprot:COSAG01_NODE_3082_length_6620_cov_24.480754_5_plen_68_part_00
MGKPVDNQTGKVDHHGVATTPTLQLLVVVYTFEINSTLCRRVHPPLNTTECLYHTGITCSDCSRTSA